MSDETISNFLGESAEVFLDELSINGYGLINLALDKILDEDIRATLSDCEESLIACEIVAAVGGHPAFDFPEDLSEWIQMFLAPGSDAHLEIISLTEKAADVVDRLVADSELREFWDDDLRLEAWVNAQVELQNRILK